MMAALVTRGQAIADRAQGEAVARVAAAAGEALPGVAVTAQPDGVTLAAHGLSRRLADEPQLRWIGSLVR